MIQRIGDVHGTALPSPDDRTLVTVQKETGRIFVQSLHKKGLNDCNYYYAGNHICFLREMMRITDNISFLQKNATCKVGHIAQISIYIAHFFAYEKKHSKVRFPVSQLNSLYLLEKTWGQQSNFRKTIMKIQKNIPHKRGLNLFFNSNYLSVIYYPQTIIAGLLVVPM